MQDTLAWFYFTFSWERVATENDTKETSPTVRSGSSQRLDLMG